MNILRVFPICCLVALTSLVSACTGPHINEERWQEMQRAEAQYRELASIYRQKQAQARALSAREKAQLLADAYPFTAEIIRHADPARPGPDAKTSWRREYYKLADGRWGTYYERAMEATAHPTAAWSGSGFADAPLVNYVYIDLARDLRDRGHVRRLAAKFSRDGVPSNAQVEKLFALAKLCGRAWPDRHKRKGGPCVALAKAVE